MVSAATVHVCSASRIDERPDLPSHIFHVDTHHRTKKLTTLARTNTDARNLCCQSFALRGAVSIIISNSAARIADLIQPTAKQVAPAAPPAIGLKSGV